MTELLSQLEAYGRVWPEEKTCAKRFQSFLKEYPTCFERTLEVGHVTGSALVMTEDFSKVLLTHHAKLNKWLQLGGHCDGNPLVFETALRETKEESGLKEIHIIDASRFVNLPSTATPLFFDIDIHEIPVRKTVPAHLHYDLRFLVTTPTPEKIQITQESQDLRWFTLPEAADVAVERSMLRMFEKLRIIDRHHFDSRF